MLALLDAAVSIWGSVGSSDLHFERATAPTSTTAAEFLSGDATQLPVIVCDANFSANNSANADYVPALTRLAASGGFITYGGIIVNAESGAGANIANLEFGPRAITIAHEIGHVLGLGHSSKLSALMYYSIAEKTVAFLSQDDLDGVAYLYPRNEINSGAFGCAATRPRGGSRNLPGFFAWLMLLPLTFVAGRALERRVFS